jgi:hypothetical protein
MRVRQRLERHPRPGIAGQGNRQILRQINAAFAVVGDDLHPVRRSDAHPGLLPRRAREEARPCTTVTANASAPDTSRVNHRRASPHTDLAYAAATRTRSRRDGAGAAGRSPRPPS